MKDKLVKDIEIKLVMNGYNREETERIMCCVISCLSSYEVTEAVTDLVVRYEDQNEQILKNYTACMVIDGRSKRTISGYLWTLRKLSDLVRKPFTELTANDIRMFLGSIKTKGNKNSYVKNQRSKVSGFCKWMYAEDLIAKDPCIKVGAIKEEQEVRLPYTAVEIDRLRSSITGRHAVRDRAIMEVLLSSGLRVEELCDLKLDDVDLRERTVHVRCGKGGKGRVVYMSEVAAEYVNKYLRKRKDSAEKALFMGQRGPLGIDGVQNMLRKYGKIADVENVHPHRFRRTFATTCYRHGMDLEEIRKLMGHTDIKTTLRYIYSTRTQLKAAYDKYAA